MAIKEWWQRKPNWLRRGIIITIVVAVFLGRFPMFLFLLIPVFQILIISVIIVKVAKYVKRNWLKYMIIGGVTGVLVWSYDYDFFINVGGPSAPISNSIRNFFSLGHCSFVPLYILMIALGISGLIIGFLVDLIVVMVN
ncbi:hypothetical protein D4R87_02440 [bacterium]|nr:MAG: hypothetical protein D4R87_02440 [bacterium]